MTSHELTPSTIAALLVDSEPWLSCDDCFEQVDTAIERLLAEDAALDEAFRVHLAACAACHEEAESLATLIASEHGTTPEQALARLERQIGPAVS